MNWRLRQKTKKLLDEEIGTYYKDKRDVSIVLVYPNTYYVGMSNLGFATIYHLLNKREDTWCERGFLPDKEDTTRQDSTGQASLFSLESQKPLNEFDIIAFSVAFELDYFNILTILKLAKIPLYPREREAFPLIMAGGTAVTANPKPLFAFIDIFVMGEGEEVVNEIMDAYLAFRHQQGKSFSREKLLLNLSRIEGVYIPSLGQKEFKRRYISSLDSYPVHSCIVTKNTEFSRMFLIEVTRGCPQGCKFCLASHLYKPFRYRSLEVVQNQVKEGLKWTKRIGLIGGGISSHPDLIKICREIKMLGGEVSLSSLRIASITPELVSILNQKTIAVAPEAGSERLRKLINKPISEENILEKIAIINSSSLILSSPSLTLKLYFLIGLPTEIQEDIEALIKLVIRIKAGFKRELVISINPFIPKLNTPFQDMAMDSKESLNSKLRYIRKNLSGIKIISENIKDSIIQARFSIGDEKVGEFLSNRIFGGVRE
ncbi:MAG: radical SAM protein [bacterium]|nr:radical SAM protein [bacterium]